LADSLSRAGYNEDAKDIIKYAMGISKDKTMHERFMSLKTKRGLE
jgi:hypothetical protein